MLFVSYNILYKNWHFITSNCKNYLLIFEVNMESNTCNWTNCKVTGRVPHTPVNAKITHSDITRSICLNDFECNEHNSRTELSEFCF